MRSEAEVRDALAELVTVAHRAAMLPKNAEKGHWRNLGVRDLLILFSEEAGEMARAYNHNESVESLVAEIGDAAWVLAMLLDTVTGVTQVAEILRAMRTGAAPVPPPAFDTAFGSHALVTESGCALVVSASAVSRLEIYNEAPMPGCHLELKLLDAHQRCGACGYEAQLHRNWKGSRA